MVDISTLLGLAGITGKDIVGFIAQMKNNSSDDYKKFEKGLKKTIELACDAYCEYAEESREGLQCNFLDETSREKIYSKVLSNLSENKPFNIDDVLPEDKDLPDTERKLLFRFLCAYLNESLEFCLRDFKAWSKQNWQEFSKDLNKIGAGIEQLQKAFSETAAVIEKLPTKWRAVSITYEWIQKQKRNAEKSREQYRQRYYAVDSRESTYQPAICAGLDCPNREILDAAAEILNKSDSHLIIVGDGGEGKTSLLFRLAVEQVLEQNQICFWLNLRDISIDSDDNYKAEELLDSISCLISSKAKEEGKKAYLFIDNPYHGRKMLEVLNSAWRIEHSIRLVTTERTLNMRSLCSPNNNMMSTWFDSSEFICLYPFKEDDNSAWNQRCRHIPISFDWKMDTVQKMIEARQNINAEVIEKIKGKVHYSNKNKPVTLVELMYHTVYEYNKIISGMENRGKTILLDWDAWEYTIKEEFSGIASETFEFIAAFSRIGLPVSAKSFSQYYGIDQNLFERFIEGKYKNGINTPVQLMKIDSETYISAKHDAIPDLYFDFNRDRTFDSTMQHFLDKMEDDASKAEVIVQFAEYYYNNSSFSKSEIQYTKALTISEKVFGQEHPSTAATYNNIAVVYQDKGEYEKALEYYKKALAIREKVLGQEHPDTAATYNNIAGVYQAKGEYEKALENYRKALAIIEKVLGQEHPSIAMTYNNIATVYQAKGEYDKALEYSQKALNIREKVLELEHPDTAKTYVNIAGVYQAKGEYERALEYYQKAFAICEKVLGQQHPDTATTYNNIAGVYQAKGEYERALEYYKRALAIYEKVLGQEHPDTATIYNNMAVVYKANVEYDKTLEYYNKALAIREKVLGQEHPDTAKTYNNIAVLYQVKGEYEKALEYYPKALAISEKVLGQEHPDTANTYNNMAAVYQDKGEYEKAMEYFKKAMPVFEKVLGLEHPLTATTYNNIAVVYQNKGEYNKALEYYKKALAIREKVLGQEHPTTVTVYNNIALLYEDKGEYDKALEYYKKALAIREKVLGKEHPATATTYKDLAGVYQAKGEYDKALKWYIDAFYVFLKILGIEHPNTKVVFDNTYSTYIGSGGDKDNFIEWLKERLAEKDSK